MSNKVKNVSSKWEEIRNMIEREYNCNCNGKKENSLRENLQTVFKVLDKTPDNTLDKAEVEKAKELGIFFVKENMTEQQFVSRYMEEYHPESVSIDDLLNGIK
jgi:hypothetical protein